MYIEGNSILDLKSLLEDSFGLSILNISDVGRGIRIEILVAPNERILQTENAGIEFPDIDYELDQLIELLTSDCDYTREYRYRVILASEETYMVEVYEV